MNITNQIIKDLSSKSKTRNEIRSFDSKDIHLRDRVFATNIKVKIKKYSIVSKVYNYSKLTRKSFLFRVTKY